MDISLLKESIDDVINQYNPTHIRIDSFAKRVVPIFDEKMKTRVHRQWRSRPLKQTISKVLLNKGWVKSSFMEQKTDVLLNTPLKVSDYWFSYLERD